MTAAGALVLAGCESPSILRAEGSAGNEIVTLAIWIFAILAVVLLVVWGLLVFVILRDRHRPEAEVATQGRPDDRDHLDAIPAVIVAVLFFLTIRTTEQLAIPRTQVHFAATGHRWWWEFEFPAPHFKTANEIHVPAETGGRHHCCRPTSSTATGCRRWAARST